MPCCLKIILVEKILRSLRLQSLPNISWQESNQNHLKSAQNVVQMPIFSFGKILIQGLYSLGCKAAKYINVYFVCQIFMITRKIAALRRDNFFWEIFFSGNFFSGKFFSGKFFSGKFFSGNFFSGNFLSGNFFQKKFFRENFFGKFFLGNFFLGIFFSGNFFSGNFFQRFFFRKILTPPKILTPQKF